VIDTTCSGSRERGACGRGPPYSREEHVGGAHPNKKIKKSGRPEI